MKIKVTTDFNVQKILNSRGMGLSNGLRKYLAARVKARCEPYVPMQQGNLINTARIGQNGTEIVYSQPYAHYQYAGKVMAGRAPKRYTGKALDYHGGPMRGDHWDRRMMADHADDIEADVAAYLGGKAK